MKIPSKIEISNSKSQERKREIEEGVKLAKKVDSLRELSAKEQENINRFRDSSLKQIQEEINKKIDEKNVLDVEISQRKEERIKLSAPVDLKEEWEKVKQDKLQIEEWKRDLFDREAKLIEREGNVITHQKEIEKRDKSLKDDEFNARQYLEETNKSYRVVEKIRDDIEERKKSSDNEINLRYSSLLDKEEKFSKIEQSFKLIQEQVESDKKEMLDRGATLIQREGRVELKEKELFDREETLKENENLNKRYLTESQENYEKTENLKLEIEKNKKDSDKEINLKHQQAERKEKELEFKERDLNLEKEQIIREKALIANEKLHITSQQETLRVAWENIKKLQK